MKISCIIPAFNEESTIINVIKNVKKIKVINEIVVVDDGSTDNTYKNAKSEEVKVIKHAQNKGKGAAIKTGVSHSSGEIILFLDADLYSISPKKIASILQPLENDEADFVKTSIKRDLLKGLKIDDKWGVDIQILLQLVKKGVRISEVDIGRLKHKKQSIENLTIMSEQVIKTILSELGIIANKHKLVLFDFDKTLIRESSIEIVAKEFGFKKELQVLRANHKNGKIKDYDITLELAKLIKGRTEKDFENVFENINLRRTAKGVVERLKKRQYTVSIISVA